MSRVRPAEHCTNAVFPRRKTHRQLNSDPMQFDRLREYLFGGGQ